MYGLEYYKVEGDGLESWFQLEERALKDSHRYMSIKKFDDQAHPERLDAYLFGSTGWDFIVTSKNGTMGKEIGEKWHMTGFFFPKVADESTIDPEVVQFLDRCGDKPPIVFGLGSIPIKEPEVLYPMVARVCKRIGRKAIILTGWTPIKGDIPQEEDVLFLKEIDHGYLLKRVACNVTHGGCGSVGASLRAGTPVVVAAMYFDQPYWGRRVEEMGVGRTFSLLDLQEDDLYLAINRVVTHSAYKTKAMELSKHMAKSNGVIRAAYLVENILKSKDEEYFIFEDNRSIQPGDLPMSIKTLTFGDKFDQAIRPGTLPSDLTTLIFGDNFDKPIGPDILPSSLTTLVFRKHFNRPIRPGMLPSSLKTLIFGDRFNQPLVPGALPLDLTTLVFGKCFDQDLASLALPEGLTMIKFRLSEPQLDMPSWADRIKLHNLPTNLVHLILNVDLGHGNVLDLRKLIQLPPLWRNDGYTLPQQLTITVNNIRSYHLLNIPSHFQATKILHTLDAPFHQLQVISKADMQR
eukprot:gene16111-19170_t